MFNIIKRKLRKHVTGYDHIEYWNRRNKVVDKHKNYNKVFLVYNLYRLKRIEGKNNSSLGTNIGSGAKFLGIPTLPHGLSGIYVSPLAKIGKNARIFQQVTIGQQDQKAPVLGDNVQLGAGVKVIGGVKIGNNVTVGANAVVISDLPDNCFAAGVPAEIKKRLNN